MGKVLRDLSDQLANAVESAGVGVVRIDAGRRFPASGTIWSEDGVIVTASHVLRRGNDVSISLSDGDRRSAKVAGRDPATDLAVLKVNGDGLAAPNWIDPDGLKVGHLVLALSRPGRTVRSSLGIVSALAEGWTTPWGGHLDHYLQTDVIPSPGFSGGPLVDGDGQILGMNSAGVLRGLSLTLTTPTLRRLVDTLLRQGRIPTPYLGIRAQPARLSQSVSEQLDQETGLLIASVEAGSPAAKGGLMMGDAIVGIGGQPVREFEELIGFLTPDRVGKPVSIRVVRAGEVREVEIEVGERG